MGSLNRRQLMHGIAVGAGAATLGSRADVLGQNLSSGEAPPPPAAPFPAPREGAGLFDDLGPGTTLGRWRVVEIHPVTMGAIPVVMSDAEGRLFQVDVLRRDAGSDGARAVCETAHLALYLANVGRGDTATREDHGLAAMALGDALRAREAACAIPRLLTLRARVAGYPTGVFSVLPRT